MYFAESSPAPLEPQPLPRRRRSPRPAAPPPYPGRSIILNYDYDDPQSWKNNLDKPQVVSSLTKSSEDEDTTPGLPGTTPARAATPVAAGAVLTLAELKRKQMCKRLAKLAASGKADNGNSEKEEDVDSAEASLELKLRRLIARDCGLEDIVNIHVTSQASLSLSAPDTQTEHSRASPHTDDLSAFDEHQSHRHTEKRQHRRPPPRSTNVNQDKFHFYGPKAPCFPTSKPVSGRCRRTMNAAQFQETYGTKILEDRNRITRSHSFACGNESPAPYLPPLSPENRQRKCRSPVRESDRWNDPVTADNYQLREQSKADDDLDSNGERRESSEEGFGMNNQEDEVNEEMTAKNRVLGLLEMQMELLKGLNVMKPGVAAVKGHDVRPSSRISLQRTPSNANLGEREMQQRCELLEDHIAALTKNIEEMTEEIQSQQASLRHLEMNQKPRVRFADEVSAETSARALWSPPNSPNSSQTLLSVSRLSGALDGVKEYLAVPNPETVNKLTKFFGTEPPLVRLFLRKLGYEKYARLFEIEKIGLNELPYMTEDRLLRLGVPMGPRTRILREAQFLMQMDRNSLVQLV